MFVAKIVDGQIADTGTLRDLFPNTSFPASGPDSDWMTENNVQEVITTKPYDRATQKLETVSAYLEDGVVYDVNVVDLTADEISANQAEENSDKAASVRRRRDLLLAQSDWTVLQDSPLTDAQVAEWVIYRQALRDITSHANFPNLNSGDQIDGTGSDWPAKPE